MDQSTRVSLGTLIGVSVVVSIMCGGGGFLIGAFGSQLLAPTVRVPSTPEPPAEILAFAVVAVEDIAVGMTIDEEMVTTVPYPAEYLIESMVLDPTSVVGKAARVEIRRGMVLTTGMLLEPGAPSIPEPPTEVLAVIAVEDIPAGTIIGPDMVTLMPYPADYVIEGMILDLVSVVGMTARVEIRRGMVLTTRLLLEP